MTQVLIGMVNSCGHLIIIIILLFIKKKSYNVILK